jgi:hypothetical protein
MMIEALIIHHLIGTNDLTGLQNLNKKHLQRPWDHIAEVLSQSPVLTYLSASDTVPEAHRELFRNSMNNAESYRRSPIGKNFRLDEAIAELRIEYMKRYSAAMITKAQQDLVAKRDPLAIARDLTMAVGKVSHIGQRAKSTMQRIHETGEERNVSISLALPGLEQADFDRVWMGNLGVLGGPSGAFKSTLALEFIRKATEQNDNVIGAMFQAEQPAREMIYKLLSSITDFSYEDIQLNYHIDNPQFMQAVRREAGAYKEVWDRIHVFDSNDFRTADDIANHVLRLSASGKHVFFVVDYLTRLKIRGAPNEGYVEALNTLKDLVMDTDSFGLIVSQLLKGWNLDYARRPVVRMPTRDDLIWSSELSNLAANIITIMRPSAVDKAAQATADGRALLMASIEKIRHQDRSALVPLKVNGSSQTFRIPDPLDMQYFKKFEGMITKKSFVEDF